MQDDILKRRERVKKEKILMRKIEIKLERESNGRNCRGGT